MATATWNKHKQQQETFQAFMRLRLPLGRAWPKKAFAYNQVLSEEKGFWCFQAKKLKLVSPLFYLSKFCSFYLVSTFKI